MATLTGLPAGIPVDVNYLDRQLWRRQQGYGRGGRMKIETDRVRIVSGVRHSETIGSPIAILIENKDWKNWTAILPVEAKDGDPEQAKPVSRPGPVTPIWRVRSSTIFRKPATSWNGRVQERRRRVSPWAR